VSSHTADESEERAAARVRALEMRKRALQISKHGPQDAAPQAWEAVVDFDRRGRHTVALIDDLARLARARKRSALLPEAVEAMREAVECCRKEARDQEWFEHELAVALLNMALCLEAAEQRGEAVRAAQESREKLAELAAQDPRYRRSVILATAAVWRLRWSAKRLFPRHPLRTWFTIR
jgi:hypothetical protein